MSPALTLSREKKPWDTALENSIRDLIKLQPPDKVIWSSDTLGLFDSLSVEPFCDAERKHAHQYGYERITKMCSSVPDVQLIWVLGARSKTKGNLSGRTPPHSSEAPLPPQYGDIQPYERYAKQRRDHELGDRRVSRPSEPQR